MLPHFESIIDLVAQTLPLQRWVLGLGKLPHDTALLNGPLDVETLSLKSLSIGLLDDVPKWTQDVPKLALTLFDG